MGPLPRWPALVAVDTLVWKLLLPVNADIFLQAETLTLCKNREAMLTFLAETVLQEFKRVLDASHSQAV
jgi:hypothetical protein